MQEEERTTGSTDTPEPAAGQKLPILFDDHTDTSKIELQYFVDTRVGKKTCMARCEFCWMNRSHIANHHQDIEKARRIIGGLRNQGYSVIPIVSDSFAENGKYLRSGLFQDNNDWYLGTAAWSSGRPLLRDNYVEMLDLCVENKIETIIMTSHGTEDRERPFRGLTQPSVVRKAVRRVKEYCARGQWDFRIILTFTLSRANCSADDIRGYLDYCEGLGVQVARFNRFADIRGTHPHLIMSREEVEDTYRTLRETYEAHPGRVQMSVSEDFGSWGVEVMGFPPQVGHCVAGERLFGVVYPYVYVCPVNLTVVAGKIEDDYTITWNPEVKERLMTAKAMPEFGGCMGVAYPHFPKVRAQFEGLEQHR